MSAEPEDDYPDEILPTLSGEDRREYLRAVDQMVFDDEDWLMIQWMGQHPQ